MNQVAIRQSNEIAISNSYNAPPSEHELMVYHAMAEQAVTSKMYKGVGEKAGIMMIMLSARELGIAPMQALNGGLNIINGKVEISARMMSALIRKAGHQIKVVECSETQCKLIGTRCDTGETLESSFSVLEAQKAGIVKAGGGWTKFPKDMCFARALSRLARQLFSDVIGLGYVEGEISGTVEVKNAYDDSEVNHKIENIEEIEIVDEQDYTQKFIDIFDQDDKPFALEYFKVVQKHFGWTVKQTFDELIKDRVKLYEKFNSWKNKFTQAENA